MDNPQNTQPIETKEKTQSGRRTPRKSGFRNRRRANLLKLSDLREAQLKWRQSLSTEQVGNSKLLPRAEAVDVVLMDHDARLDEQLALISEVRELLGKAPICRDGFGRPLGRATSSAGRNAVYRSAVEEVA